MIALAAVLAVGIGMAVGLLGGGGSILTTPLLIYVLGFDAKQAIAASLFVVGGTSIFGVFCHSRAGRVVCRIGLIFGAAGMVGAFIGGQIGARLPSTLLLAAFAVMMGITAVAMIRGRKQVPGHAHKGLPLFRILLDGLIVGFVTGLVGAGGGFLVVPALALLAGLAMPRAVATSLLVVAMKSFAGLAGYIFTIGGDSIISLNPATKFNWPVTLIITGAAVVGALIGSSIVGRIHPDKLRKAFGYFVLVMAVFMLSQQVGLAVLDYADNSLLNAGEVILGALVIVAVFTWIIRRPAQVAVADFDEPIAEGSPDPASDRS
ncbi:MAG: sulfite exporter TauE/SafE family protein [bacterium]